MIYKSQSYRLVIIFVFIRLVLGIFSNTSKEEKYMNRNLAVSNNIPVQEIFALQELYVSTRGDEWTWLNSSNGIPWNFTANCNPCEENWQGLTCKFNPQHSSHIVDISLSNHNLNGSLPTALINFTELERFTVDYNNIIGTIPACLGNLTSLIELQLSYNKLTGTIPATLGQLQNLEFLWLVHIPELVGSIPAELGNLSQLKRLYLKHTSVTGSIPAELGNLSMLIVLFLDDNSLTGSIPAGLGNLSQLLGLDLSDTSITGSIPAELGNLSQLVELYLDHTFLTGSIPASLGNLKELSDLYLDDTSITGSIPASLGNLSELNMLYLYDTSLTGSIPAELGNLRELLELYLDDTSITGTIPAELGKLKNLLMLYLDDTSLTGSIPASLGLLRQLTWLDLGYTSLTGSIPTELGSLNQLIALYLSHTFLTGSIPAELGNLKDLEKLVLSASFLTGTIPASLGNLTALSLAVLNNNFLTGTVLSSFGQMPQLRQLHLDHNLLSGILPTSLSDIALLIELNLQSNKLSGTLKGIFNSDTQQFLQYVNVGNNQLTGPLPTEAFQLPKLTTFVAMSNCFSGTLSTTICSNTVLVSLILDGVQAAPACQQRLLPHTSSHSYSTTSSFTGHIPSCLFNMSNLISLHLSGNGLSGSLPEDLVVSDHLVDLILSHNLLTGSIPRAIQHRMWKNLDLSYNRLGGKLDSDFAAQKVNLSLTLDGKTYNLSDSTTYSLQNNRLSRTVPSRLVNPYNVSLLGSNMFECNVQKSDLPQHDDQRSNYQCGSDSFNWPFYLWLVAIFGAGVFLASCVWCVSTVKRSAVVTHVLECLQKWNLPKGELPRNFRYVSSMSDILCQISVWCTALIVLVLVPWYTVATLYYGTYSHQYAWTVSAAFLSGPEATAVQLVVYVLVLAVMVGALIVLLVQYDREQHHVRSRLDTWSKDGRYELTVDEHRTLAQRLLVYWAFATVNIMVVGGVNVAFVLIALTESNRAVAAAQIGLSLFKLGWNSAVNPHLIQSLSAYISHTAQSTGLVTVQVLMALFNNIALPCLIVAVISPSCFYTLFHPASTVTSQFIYLSCTHTGVSGACDDVTPEVTQTAYDPPFRYDYQCSSSFVTYYAPAFVYLGFATSFAVPMVKVVAQQLQKCCVVDSVQYRILNFAIMSRIMRPLSVVLPSGEVVSTERRDPVDSTGVDNSVSFSRSSRTWVQYETLKRDMFRPIFDANSFIISLVTYLGILLTFGMVFPPLAVVMCVTILSVTWQAKLTVGRFLCNTRELHLYKFEEILEQECTGAVTIMKLRQSVALIVICSCCFYALFLFDTLGNAQGWGRAYWVLIVMPLLPMCCLLLGYTLHRRRRGELFRDSGSYIKEEQGSSRAIELSATVQNMQHESGAAGSEMDNQAVSVQEGRPPTGDVAAAGDDGCSSEGIESSTVSVLHV